jgi:nicotinamide-nucleotide adenylyltransferase
MSHNHNNNNDSIDIENVLTDINNNLIENSNKPLFKIIFKNLENWPFLLNSFISNKQQQHTTRIAILDSSFNPPTKAHLKLLENSIINYNNNSQNFIFHASLLLYSINNVDKITSSSDAKLIDRLIMMKILASCIINSQKSNNNSLLQNLAVGVTTQARFIDKANAIHSSFNNNSNNNSNNNISLYFIMGFDTIIRLFNPNYYNDIKKELGEFFTKNYIICANRDGHNNDEIEKFLNNDIVKEIVNINNNNNNIHEKKILRIILNEEISRISSSKVRELIKNNSNIESSSQNNLKELLYELSPKPIIDYIINKNFYKN